jgi:pyruvate kinase
MSNSRAQIIATIGPASSSEDVLSALMSQRIDLVRLNFSWGTHQERKEEIDLIRMLEIKQGRRVPIIIDLPGPRVQYAEGHSYNEDAGNVISEKDKESIAFGIANNVDYFALSFVGSSGDVKQYKDHIAQQSGTQKVIAKIERKAAVDALAEIINHSDAIMVARGDLGAEIPLEEIPFVQETIISLCNKAGCPVITATQMLISMTENAEPTRAEVTDVSVAIIQGSDAVMLSEETARGKYPVEAVVMMEKIIFEAEKHIKNRYSINPL